MLIKDRPSRDIWSNPLRRAGTKGRREGVHIKDQSPSIITPKICNRTRFFPRMSMRLNEYRIFKVPFFFFISNTKSVILPHIFFHETLLSYSEFYSLLPYFAYIFSLVSLTKYLGYSVACLLLRFSQPGAFIARHTEIRHKATAQAFCTFV